MSTRPAGDDGRWPSDDRLAAVFRAAAAPAHATELAGEEAAMAAFRAAAVTEPAAEPERSSTLRNVLTKVLTVKAMVVLAVAGSAGIVVAATGGVLPTPWSPPPAEQRAAPPAPAPTGKTGTRSDPVPSASAGKDAPEIVELCRKYLRHGHQDKALDNPAFGPLIDVAGGAEKVAAYCATHAEDKPDDGKTPPGPATGDENGNGPGDGPDNDNGENKGNGPGEHGRPDNPGNSANPGVPENNNGNPGTPPNPPPAEPKKTEPRAPENARTSAPGSPARGAASPSSAGPPSQGG